MASAIIHPCYIQRLCFHCSSHVRRGITSSAFHAVNGHPPQTQKQLQMRHFISCGGTSGTSTLVYNTSMQQIHCGSSSSGQLDARPIHSYRHPTLPKQFLDAYDDSKFDTSTHQRTDVPFDPVDGKPPPPSSSSSTNGKFIGTTKSNDWIDSQTERWRADVSDFDSLWSSTSTLDMDSDEKKTVVAKQKMQSTKRILWSNWTEKLVRDTTTSPILFQYSNLVGQNDNVKEHERLLKVLYQYGLVLISGTPSYTDTLPLDAMSEETKNIHAKTSSERDAKESNNAESAILHLASIIGYHPLQTLYGSGVWSTSSQSSFYNKEDSGAKFGESVAGSTSSASTADSAYGSTSLPLHTDMTYLSTPPGVQIFLMVQPATTATSSNDDHTFIPKGQSVYLDGFAAAQQLLKENPDAYQILANTQRTYRCIDDEEGWHLEATGPVIETMTQSEREVGESCCGPVKSIRHNDLDRLPDLPPYPSNQDSAEITDIYNDAFYHKLKEAHNAWDDILRRDDMRLVIDLKPGDCMLVSNQRCMHGRYAFEASTFPRVVMGCYVGMDELSSKWRNAGLRVL